MISLSLTACLFMAWGGDAAGVHACPHHDAVPGSPAAALASGPAHAAHGHDASPGDEQSSGPAHEHGGPCTCVGTCHAGAAAPAPSADGAQVADAGGLGVDGCIADRDGFRAVTFPYVLPYANAPPTAS